MISFCNNVAKNQVQGFIFAIMLQIQNPNKDAYLF